jgi:hypothetical protein
MGRRLYYQDGYCRVQDVDGTFIWTASHDQRQGSLSTVSFAAAIVVGPEPRSSWSAHSKARTNDLDGGENVGDQLDLPAGGCEDGALAITEGDRTPRVAAPSCRAEYLQLEVALPQAASACRRSSSDAASATQ